MKTKNACFWIFLLLSGSAYAQMSQKGTVQIFNSNKSPLPGVQLTATDAPATDTCLLYTSPSPRDRSVSRMPSSA